MKGDRDAQFWENMRTAKEDDAISRQMALDKIAEYFGDLRIVVHHDMLQIIKELPPAQPEITLESAIDYLHSIGWMQEHDRALTERKNGRWIHDGYNFPHGIDWVHCSVCGKRGINVPADLTRYCPYCGAYMNGGNDETD